MDNKEENEKELPEKEEEENNNNNNIINGNVVVVDAVGANGGGDEEDPAPEQYSNSTIVINDEKIKEKKIKMEEKESSNSSGRNAEGPMPMDGNHRIDSPTHQDILEEEEEEEEEGNADSPPTVPPTSIVSAKIVNEAELEEKFRERITTDMAMAEEVKHIIEPSSTANATATASAGGLSSKSKFGIAVFLLAGILVAIFLGVLLNRDDDDNMEEEEETPTATPIVLSRSDHLKQLFIPISDETLYQDEESAQSKAIHFLAEQDEYAGIDIYDPAYEMELLERYVMMVLYFATDGPNWEDQLLFGSNYSHCEWPNIDQDENNTYTPNEVDCNDEFRIIKLRIETNGLNGTIPSELSALPSIEIISFGGNPALGGTFPTEIAKLTTLNFWQTSGCSLTGTIPTEIVALTNLGTIAMYRNHMSGEIPDLTSFPLLQIIDFGENQLTGTIPDIVSDLVTCYMEGNNLEGTIPETYWNQPYLELLSLSNNLLTGTISTSLSNLNNMQTLWLDGNNLHGSIPTEFGQVVAMNWMWLQNNPLTGTLPSELGLLRELWWLDISNTRMEGMLPEELGELDKLTFFSLHSNSFTGTVPLSYAEMEALEQFRIYNTSLTGGLEEAFCLQDSLLTSVHADCGGDDMEISCSCCTECCNANGDQCEINLPGVCETQAGKFESDLQRNTTCQCSDDGTHLECLDETCPSCNLDGTVCAMNTMYGYDFNTTTGDIVSFHNTLEYVLGREDTILEIVIPTEGSCNLWMNGEQCRGCSGITCQSGFQGWTFYCDNVEGGSNLNMCEEFVTSGPLEIFFAYDPSQRSGCPLILEKLGV